MSNSIMSKGKEITEEQIKDFGGYNSITKKYLTFQKKWIDMAEREAEKGISNKLTLLGLRNLNFGKGSGKTGRRFGEKHT